MTTIAIANGAGSAGKTTTATSLAAIIAQRGKTVRLIDLDPQANATRWVAADAAAGTIADVLETQTPIDQVAAGTSIDRLTVVPADVDRMQGLEPALGRIVGAEQRLRLAIAAATPVDVTIIDCPGSLGLLTLAGLVAADHALTVVMPTLKELAGLPRIDELVAQVAAAYRPTLTLAGIVPCMVPAASAGRLYSDAMELLKAQWADAVTPPVRRAVKVPQSYAAGIPLPLYDPASPATGDYHAVADWTETRNLI